MNGVTDGGEEREREIEGYSTRLFPSISQSQSGSRLLAYNQRVHIAAPEPESVAAAAAAAATAPYISIAKPTETGRRHMRGESLPYNGGMKCRTTHCTTHTQLWRVRRNSVGVSGKEKEKKGSWCCCCCSVCYRVSRRCFSSSRRSRSSSVCDPIPLVWQRKRSRTEEEDDSAGPSRKLWANWIGQTLQQQQQHRCPLSQCSSSSSSDNPSFSFLFPATLLHDTFWCVCVLL